MNRHPLSILVFLMLVWTQANCSSVAYWHVWKRHSFYEIWLLEAAVTEPRYPFEPNEPMAFYTVSTVYKDGAEVW